ncbi:ABC transporter permease [Achromobacter kerstersii]
MKKRSAIQINKAVLFALILREMRTRLGDRRMGVFWVLFEPAAQVALMIYIFSAFRGATLLGMDYPIYLLMGMIPFFLFRNIALGLMEAVGANQGLFAYPNIKPFDTFVARLIVECAISSCVFILMLAVFRWFFGYHIEIEKPIQWLAWMSIGIVLAFSIGILLAIIVKHFPNSKIFIRMSFMVVYILSGVLYPIWVLPLDIFNLLKLNPFFHLVDGLREAAIAHYPLTAGISIQYPLAITLTVLFLAMTLYRSQRRELISI